MGNRAPICCCQEDVGTKDNTEFVASYVSDADPSTLNSRTLLSKPMAFNAALDHFLWPVDQGAMKLEDIQMEDSPLPRLVRLHREGGARVGMEISHGSDGVVRIRRVVPDGLVGQWNSSQPASAEIRPGSFILELGGKPTTYMTLFEINTYFATEEIVEMLVSDCAAVPYFRLRADKHAVEKVSPI
mmetsp:Transcript_6459/g.11227  ORF Transcript_6459/g.11227 Transcript_6459/m.11227 type:complete len:186 (-) Transcript_6459:90-647(-)